LPHRRSTGCHKTACGTTISTPLPFPHPREQHSRPDVTPHREHGLHHRDGDRLPGLNRQDSQCDGTPSGTLRLNGYSTAALYAVSELHPAGAGQSALHPVGDVECADDRPGSNADASHRVPKSSPRRSFLNSSAGIGRRGLPVRGQEALDVAGLGRRQLSFPFALWTLAMVRELIRRKFDVRLSEVSVGRLLRTLGLTPQRPLYRAWQQDPVLVERWQQKEYPKIKARAKKENALIYFGDESGIRSDYHAGTT
jgi:hypothetical protein